MAETIEIKPIFIFSLPRSGSTLLQRILATSTEVSTASEPWVLLPFLYALRKEGLYAEYSHFCVYHALQDLCKEMPNGKNDYLSAVRSAMIQIYTATANKTCRYFLDKTPRYSLVADEVIATFPEGKCIFLWRNPLAIIASIVETFCGGQWGIFHSKVDLFDGMENLIRAFRNNSSKVLAIRYEDLVQVPKETLGKIQEFLGTEYPESSLSAFSAMKLKGEMGDPTGVKKYDSLSVQSIDAWKVTLANPWRKTWCRRYLHWLGRDRLLVMGYDLDSLLAELDQLPNYWGTVPRDVMHAFYGYLYCAFEFKILKDKYRRMTQWKYLKKHD